MFEKSAHLYDAIYAFKDYEKECLGLKEVIANRLPKSAQSLLDVACGTGKHLEHFAHWFQVEGLDLDGGLLEQARQRLPKTPLNQGDMRDFDLGKQFDVVTCLFSAIGYASTREDLFRTVRCLANHVAPGGICLVEPWFEPKDWKAGSTHLSTTETADFKVARGSVSIQEGELSPLELHYMVVTKEGVSQFSERHVMRLHRHEEVKEAFLDAGLSYELEPVGPMGRALYIGRKAL